MPKKDPTNKEILKAIKNLAKGQQSLNNKVDSLEKGQQSLNNKVDSLEKGQQSLNNKVDSLEKGQQSLNNKVDSLEKGQQSLNNKLDSLTEWTIREITTLNGLTDSLDKKGDILIEDSSYLKRKANSFDIFKDWTVKNITTLVDKIQESNPVQTEKEVKKLKVRIARLEEKHR